MQRHRNNPALRLTHEPDHELQQQSRQLEHPLHEHSLDSVIEEIVSDASQLHGNRYHRRFPQLRSPHK